MAGISDQGQFRTFHQWSGRLALVRHRHPDSFACWERAHLPIQNAYVLNPSNGCGHLFYALRKLVGHANVTTTIGYLHRPTEHLQRVEAGRGYFSR
jgi:hypothetical protein